MVAYLIGRPRIGHRFKIQQGGIEHKIKLSSQIDSLEWVLGNTSWESEGSPIMILTIASKSANWCIKIWLLAIYAQYAQWRGMGPLLSEFFTCGFKLDPDL